MIEKFEFKPFSREDDKNRLVPILDRFNGNFDPKANKYLVFSKKAILEKIELENNSDNLKTVIYEPVDSTLLKQDKTVYFYDLFNKDIEKVFDSKKQTILRLTRFQLDFISKNFDTIIQKQITTIKSNIRCHILIVE